MQELLEKLSKSLDEAYNAASLVSALRDFFIKNFKNSEKKVAISLSMCYIK